MNKWTKTRYFTLLSIFCMKQICSLLNKDCISQLSSNKHNWIITCLFFQIAELQGKIEREREIIFLLDDSPNGHPGLRWVQRPQHLGHLSATSAESWMGIKALWVWTGPCSWDAGVAGGSLICCTTTLAPPKPYFKKNPTQRPNKRLFSRWIISETLATFSLWVSNVVTQ